MIAQWDSLTNLSAGDLYNGVFRTNAIGCICSSGTHTCVCTSKPCCYFLPSSVDAVLDGFTLAPLPDHPSVEEEVVRFTFDEVSGKIKMLENDGCVLCLGAGRVDGTFVDFQTLCWRHCLCVTDPKLRLSMINTTLFKRHFTHHQSPSSSKQRLEMTQVLLTIGTALCDFSPSLSHSCVLLLHSWRRVLQGETPQPTIFNHYIIFNNTLEDLHCGQVEVKEGVQLPAHSCHGYSWRIHHSKKQKV